VAKGYWVGAYRRVSEPDRRAAYGELASAAIEGASGGFLARGGAVTVFESRVRRARTVRVVILKLR